MIPALTSDGLIKLKIRVFRFASGPAVNLITVIHRPAEIKSVQRSASAVAA